MTLAVYSYFAAALFGRQHVINHSELSATYQVGILNIPYSKSPKSTLSHSTILAGVVDPVFSDIGVLIFRRMAQG